MDQQMGSCQMRVAVAQLGPRRQYAVPMALHQAGMLAHFYTDAWASAPLRALAGAIPRRLRPAPLRRLLSWSCPIEHKNVTSFFSLGLASRWKQRTAQDRSELTAAFLWAGERFNQLIVQSGKLNCDAVYGFHSASRTLFRHCREQGIFCILEQSAAPQCLQNAILTRELESWPDWEPASRDTCASVYAEREAAEWELADLIVAASDHVADGLADCCVSPEKCAVVPYGVSAAAFSMPRAPKAPGGPLHVLFAGAVSLRKGVPYLLSAARMLSTRVCVRIAGPICCNAGRLAAFRPPNVEIIGRVPRAEMARHFAWADVFCLPSVSDGLASVAGDALAAGLPVICTHNTGSVVRDGVDGYVVPIRDSVALAERLDKLAGDHALLAELARNARQRAREYDEESYARRLTGAIRSAARPAAAGTAPAIRTT